MISPDHKGFQMTRPETQNVVVNMAFVVIGLLLLAALVTYVHDYHKHHHPTHQTTIPNLTSSTVSTSP